MVEKALSGLVIAEEGVISGQYRQRLESLFAAALVNGCLFDLGGLIVLYRYFKTGGAAFTARCTGESLGYEFQVFASRGVRRTPRKISEHAFL